MFKEKEVPSINFLMIGKQRSTRIKKTNPRSKGTNPRSKGTNPRSKK
jgi:hypothetical protein